MAGVLVLPITLFLLTGPGAHGQQCSDGFTDGPSNQTVPEGDVRGVFYCRYPGAYSVFWRLYMNGHLLEDGIRQQEAEHGFITEDTVTYPNGTVVKMLSIAALSRFNGMVVDCYATLATGCPSEPAHLLVKAPPGPVSNVTVLLSSTSILLSWKQPSVTFLFPVILCIEVYRHTVDRSTYVYGTCEVQVNQSSYSITMPDQDPEIPYIVVVIQRYNVTGAKNGTSSSVTGFFVGSTNYIQDTTVLPCDSTSVQKYDSNNGPPIAAIVVPSIFVIISAIGLVVVVVLVCLMKPCNQGEREQTSMDLVERNSDRDPPAAVDGSRVVTEVGKPTQETKESDSGFNTASTSSVVPQDDVHVVEILETGDRVRFKKAYQCVQEDKKSNVVTKDNMNDSEGITDRSVKGQATPAQDDSDEYSKKVRPSLKSNLQQPPNSEQVVLMEESGNEEDLGNTSSVALFMGMAGDQ